MLSRRELLTIWLNLKNANISCRSWNEPINRGSPAKTKREDFIFLISFSKAKFFAIVLKFSILKMPLSPWSYLRLLFPLKLLTEIRQIKTNRGKKNPLFIRIETWIWICWSAEAVRMAGGIICYYLPSKHHHKVKTDAIAFFIMQ